MTSERGQNCELNYLLIETVADETTDDDAEVEEVTVVDDFAELHA